MRALGLDSSTVVDLTTEVSARGMVSRSDVEALLERPTVVLVDDVVRLVVDAAEPAQGSREPLAIHAMLFYAVVLPNPLVRVEALTGEGIFPLDDTPSHLPPPIAPHADEQGAEPAVTGLQVVVPSVVAHRSTVQLLAILTRPGDDDPDVAFAAEVGDKISVAVWPQEGMQVQGPSVATIEVTEGPAGAQDEATVELLITSNRKATAIVEAFRGQTSLGSVLVEMRVVVGAAPVAAAPRAAVIPLLRGHAPRSVAGSAIDAGAFER